MVVAAIVRAARPDRCVPRARYRHAVALPALPTGASVFRIEIPESYIVQLVTTVRLDASARTSLLARHPFLRAATRFAEDCVPFR